MESRSIHNECKDLIDSCQTLTLATSNQEQSHSSYAPFIYLDKKFYILVSGLAEHTSNLLHAQNKIGCMLIKDEAKSKQIFARKRFMFKSMPLPIDRKSKQWDELMGHFKTRFGDIIDLLDSLPDFVLFELNPVNAVLVKGFGDAHQLTDSDLDQLG